MQKVWQKMTSIATNLIDDTQKISRPHAPGFDGVVVVRKA